MYGLPSADIVSLFPFSVNAGGSVSIMMGMPVRLSCVSLAAYPVEFVAKMSNVRLPFVSL